MIHSILFAICIAFPASGMNANAEYSATQNHVAAEAVTQPAAADGSRYANMFHPDDELKTICTRLRLAIIKYDQLNPWRDAWDTIQQTQTVMRNLILELFSGKYDVQNLNPETFQDKRSTELEWSPLFYKSLPTKSCGYSTGMKRAAGADNIVIPS